MPMEPGADFEGVGDVTDVGSRGPTTAGGPCSPNCLGPGRPNPVGPLSAPDGASPL